MATLTVRGWKSILQGRPRRLTFEQKDGTWTTKEAGYQPSTRPRSPRSSRGCRGCTSSDSSPAGKGLTLDEDALQVEVTLADKTVLDLTVGAADGAGYFATSKQLKGDTFLVGKALFEEVRKAKGTSRSEYESSPGSVSDG